MTGSRKATMAYYLKDESGNETLITAEYLRSGLLNSSYSKASDAEAASVGTANGNFFAKMGYTIPHYSYSDIRAKISDTFGLGEEALNNESVFASINGYAVLALAYLIYSGDMTASDVADFLSDNTVSGRINLILEKLRSNSDRPDIISNFARSSNGLSSSVFLSNSPDYDSDHSLTAEKELAKVSQDKVFYSAYSSHTMSDQIIMNGLLPHTPNQWTSSHVKPKIPAYRLGSLIPEKYNISVSTEYARDGHIALFSVMRGYLSASTRSIVDVVEGIYLGQSSSYDDGTVRASVSIGYLASLYDTVYSGDYDNYYNTCIKYGASVSVGPRYSLNVKEFYKMAMNRVVSAYAFETANIDGSGSRSSELFDSNSTAILDYYKSAAYVRSLYEHSGSALGTDSLSSSNLFPTTFMSFYDETKAYPAKNASIVTSKDHLGALMEWNFQTAIKEVFHPVISSSLRSSDSDDLNGCEVGTPAYADRYLSTMILPSGYANGGYETYWASSSVSAGYHASTSTGTKISVRPLIMGDYAFYSNGSYIHPESGLSVSVSGSTVSFFRHYVASTACSSSAMKSSVTSTLGAYVNTYDSREYIPTIFSTISIAGNIVKSAAAVAISLVNDKIYSAFGDNLSSDYGRISPDIIMRSDSSDYKDLMGTALKFGVEYSGTRNYAISKLSNEFLSGFDAFCTTIQTMISNAGLDTYNKFDLDTDTERRAYARLLINSVHDKLIDVSGIRSFSDKIKRLMYCDMFEQYLLFMFGSTASEDMYYGCSGNLESDAITFKPCFGHDGFRLMAMLEFLRRSLIESRRVSSYTESYFSWHYGLGSTTVTRVPHLPATYDEPKTYHDDASSSARNGRVKFGGGGRGIKKI